MRDVHPPARSKGPIGPIDELGLMRLVDVRRLGGSLAERKERLIRKFTTLKSESYPLYLKGRSAWFLSPLYRAYQDSIVRAINAGSPMSDVIGSGGADDLNAEEFQMLIDVNRTLKI